MVVLKEKALSAVDLVSAVAADIASFVGLPGGVLQLGLQRAKERYLANATKILITEIRRGNISGISDQQYDVLIPGAYRFYEAARYGEYNHNLKVLGRLLIGELKAETGDSEKISRMSRRLQSMSLDEMETLVACGRAFDVVSQSSQFDGFHLFLDVHAVLMQLGLSYVAPATKVNSHLADLCSRGFLFVSGNPEVLGGHFYYKTEAFNEVVEQAKAALSENTSQ